MEKIIRFVISNRLFFIVLGLFVFGAGYYSYQTLAVEAFPDVTPTMVQVFTATESLAPEDVENYITYPVEVAMNGLPGLKYIRSSSSFGISIVSIYFEEGTDFYFARQLVAERLQHARESIPEGFGEPELGPIASAMGQVLLYLVEDESGEYGPEEIRTLQDWLIKFNLRTVPGVTEVISIGGEVKQFQVRIRPADLLRYDLTLGQVARAVKANNSNAGAEYIVKNSQEYVVRSVGLVSEISDLERIVLKSQAGTPVYLDQVADIVIGGAERRGLATVDGQSETVVGMVLKLFGDNSSRVIANIKERIEQINRILPPGVRIVTFYDQAELVEKCLRTVSYALLLGMIFVIIVLVAFMGGFSPSLVAALSIPFSILFAFIWMRFFGLTANLMSLGGLAIAIGILVDGTIVVVENIEQKLRGADDENGTRVTLIAEAVSEVGRPIIFAISIIIIVFLPLFTLQGVEGKTFRPLAYTVSLAMVGSLIYSTLLAPLASYLFIRSTGGKGMLVATSALIDRLAVVYEKILRNLIRKRQPVLWGAAAAVVLGLAVSPFVGSEFVPRMHEGDLMIRGVMAPSISLDEAREMCLRFERRLMESFPEVTRVVSRIGYGEVGAHAGHPPNNAEIFVSLKPREQWSSADEPDELYSKMSHAFEDFPGMQFSFTQPIAASVDELITGSKSEVSVKLFGPDMEVLSAKAGEIEQVIRTVRGASDVEKDQVTGTRQLRIMVDREAIARWGMNVEDVQSIVRTAVGGEVLGQVFQETARFDILLRYAPTDRQTKEDIANILVSGPGKLRVPLEELASIEEVSGPMQIMRENGQRFTRVQCNVRGRDIGSFVDEADRKVLTSVQLPPGYLVSWGGQFELQREANRRLLLVVPITLSLVFLLIFSSFNSLKKALLIMSNVPLALVGGVVALWLTGENFSVPASVGFIALFGIALENAMVLVSCIDQRYCGGLDVEEASVRGAVMRLRPVLMTAATTALGLTPLLFSSGTGSEIQRPLAIVVVGGLISANMMTLFVMPTVFKWFSGRR